MTAPLRTLFPAVEPFDRGMLAVGHEHQLYYEQSGQPDGVPVVFLHGGPGGGTHPRQRRFFNPRLMRIVLFDQRGCGLSRPLSCLEHNTTAHLVADIERLREHLGIASWHVFGGSWGSTLALAYAQAHPARVRSMTLRGIFLMRPKELRWFYQYGASELFPEAWSRFVEPIALEERGNMIDAYYRRLTAGDLATQMRAARAWCAWEASTSFLVPRVPSPPDGGDDPATRAFARIEAHYFQHGGFLDAPDALLRDVPRIAHVPAVLVHGRYDTVCPLESAWTLHQRWPASHLRIVPNAGHSGYEPGIVDALVTAIATFAEEA